MVSESKIKSTKSRSRKGGSSSAAGGAPDKLKTVIRRLPPNLPEEIFWQSVQPWVTEETASWKQFHQGKMRKRYNKENIPSRAYIAFKNSEFLATFSQAYDGHLFRDKAGNESRAIVEFAPYQKVPSEKKKADVRMGTIEQDEDYISFINTLNAPATKPSDAETLEALVASTHSQPEVKTTPLLEALIAEKSALKDKEAILRNHAHYRDGAKRDKGKGPIIVAAGSSRGGRGATAASAVAGAGDSHGHSGKRARRGKNKDDAKETGDGGATPKGPVHIQLKSGVAPSGPAPAAGGSRRQRDRNREAQKAAATSEQQTSTETQSTSAPTTIALITDDLPDEGPPTPIPASATQRRRPAIALGLQSRHFEAALSGVVPGGPRTPRRERREKEKEGAAGAEGAAIAAGSGTTEFDSASGAAAYGAGGGERKVSDGSRSRRRAERGDKGASKDTPASPPQKAPPKILRRESVSSTNAPSTSSAGIIQMKLAQASTTGSDVRSTSPFDTPISGGRGRGERGRGGPRGGRRGRGRGRGRGEGDGGASAE